MVKQIAWYQSKAPERWDGLPAVEAQQVGYVQEWGDCPMVWDAGMRMKRGMGKMDRGSKGKKKLMKWEGTQAFFQTRISWHDPHAEVHGRPLILQLQLVSLLQ